MQLRSVTMPSEWNKSHMNTDARVTEPLRMAAQAGKLDLLRELLDSGLNVVSVSHQNMCHENAPTPDPHYRLLRRTGGTTSGSARCTTRPLRATMPW
jgi:hypothetical protein